MSVHDQTVQRRLAAILSADVVGYARLMEADEAGTLARLEAHRRECTDPQISAHNGRLVKLMGDGALVEFGSVVEAVRCAVEIQRAMLERNGAVPEFHRIEFRIGINVGDVIVRDGDIYGDGVNIAARLEQLSEPGGVCISGDAYRQARGKLDVAFEDLGPQRVKNIAEPLSAYRVVTEGASASAPIVRAPLPDKPSIAVLPFDNLSNDPEQEWFADGMTDDLITDLSKISGLFVIARNSTFTYKGRAVDVRKVGDALGVRYVLEGSVRRRRDKIRINAQLIEAETGGHLWADRYDGDDADLFTLQDEVIEKIVDSLAVTLTPAEQSGVTRQPTRNLEAYEHYKRGEAALMTGAYADEPLAEALAEYECAVALDPSFAEARAGAAMAAYLVWSTSKFLILTGPEARGRAIARAGQALDLDPRNARAMTVLAQVDCWAGEVDDAIRRQRTAIACDPNDPIAHAALGNQLTAAGRHAEAVEAIDAALRLDPTPTHLFLVRAAWSLFFAGAHERSLEYYERVRAAAPTIPGLSCMIAANHVRLGSRDEARASLVPDPGWRAANVQWWAQASTLSQIKNAADCEMFLGALRAAGLPEWPFGIEGRAEDRLSEDELRVFLPEGSRAVGTFDWGLGPKPFVQTAGPDGRYEFRSGDTVDTGVHEIRDGMLWYLSTIWNMGRITGGYVYRNPEGLNANEDEYLYVHAANIRRFSVTPPTH